MVAAGGGGRGMASGAVSVQERESSVDGYCWWSRSSVDGLSAAELAVH